MHIHHSKTVVALIACAFLATGVLACGEPEEAANQHQQQQDDNEDENNEDENNEDQNQNDGEEIDPDDWNIEVAGVWETDFDGEEVITDEQWDFREMVDFDNDDRTAITQNPEDDDDDFAGTYSRVVWTELQDDQFHYCEDVFGADSEEDAREAESVADEDDLEGGCGEGGFSWTEMTRK